MGEMTGLGRGQGEGGGGGYQDQLAEQQDSRAADAGSVTQVDTNTITAMQCYEH